MGIARPCKSGDRSAAAHSPARAQAHRRPRLRRFEVIRWPPFWAILSAARHRPLDSFFVGRVQGALRKKTSKKRPMPRRTPKSRRRLDQRIPESAKPVTGVSWLPAAAQQNDTTLVTAGDAWYLPYRRGRVVSPAPLGFSFARAAGGGRLSREELLRHAPTLLTDGAACTAGLRPWFLSRARRTSSNWTNSPSPHAKPSCSVLPPPAPGHPFGQRARLSPHPHCRRFRRLVRPSHAA